MCSLCQQQSCPVDALFCQNCHHITQRLPRFLRSPQCREFLRVMLKEAEQFDDAFEKPDAFTLDIIPPKEGYHA
jgi:hypothetical protein